MNRQSSFFSLLWFLARPWLHTFPSLTIAFILSQTMPPTHKERPSAMKRSNGGSNVALSKRTTRNSPAIEDAASTKLTEESPKPEPPPLKGSVKPIEQPPTTAQFLQDHQTQRLFQSNSFANDNNNSHVRMVAAIHQHNLDRGMILNDTDLKHQIVAFVNHVLIYYIPFPDWQHLSDLDKQRALGMIQRRLGLSDSDMATRRKAIERHLSKALRNRRTESSNRCKDSYLGRPIGAARCNFWCLVGLTCCDLFIPLAGQMVGDGNQFAGELRRSSFLCVDSALVGPNIDIVHRHAVDNNGRPVRTELGGVQELDDDDSVDPRDNYREEKKHDLFESVDVNQLDALDKMKQGHSCQGFELLAYIIVDFLCEAVKCPRNIDCLKMMHQDIFTWLPIRHLAYTIVLVEHSVNRWVPMSCHL